MGSKLFSLSEQASIYFKEEEAKIEIINCPYDKKQCVKQLPDINKYFHESLQYRLDKDYQKAIKALALAFEVTYEINEIPCDKCAGIFRSTIISSLEIIHAELKDMTTGWFRSKRFLPSFEFSAKVLKEMKDKIQSL